MCWKLTLFEKSIWYWLSFGVSLFVYIDIFSELNICVRHKILDILIFPV